MLDSFFDRILRLVLPERKSKGYLPDFVVIFAVLFLADVILGALGSAGPVFKWIFLAANVPFGALFVWVESSYVGDAAYLLGIRVGEIGGGIVFLFVVLAQSMLYLFLYERLIKKRIRPVVRAASSQGGHPAHAD